MFSTFIAAQFSGGLSNLRHRSNRAMASITSSLIDTSEEARQLVKDASEAVGVQPPSKVYELHGQAVPPFSWGDDTVIVDLDYLESVPYDAQKMLVAEKVLEAANHVQHRERICTQASLVLSGFVGGAVVGIRRKKPKTLRLAFGGSIMAFAASMIASDKLLIAKPLPNAYLAGILDSNYFPRETVEKLLKQERYRQELFISRNKMVVKRHLPADQQNQLAELEIKDSAMRITLILKHLSLENNNENLPETPTPSPSSA
eukprot:TRINITY_DN19191_c0_g1_i1.p1 TRINITY_DN19191_c0_g1~~TRINITY_DN19191_c0_g1_i1.p1  ORF type:complete len:259 (+),score=37.85 TRINITY_DN19191_c0_g1_i1:80-856(+)